MASMKTQLSIFETGVGVVRVQPARTMQFRAKLVTHGHTPTRCQRVSDKSEC